MKSKLLLILLTLSAFYSLSLQAKEIAGINIPDSTSISDQSTKLILNGAGIRTKFIFDIYIGSLYLEKKAHTAKEIYQLAGEKQISMHFLYKEVSKEKLTNGWTEGFENNLSEEQFKKIQPRLKQFNALFTTMKKGDVINMNLIPTTGTQVVINSKIMGVIEGDDFFTSLLKIWLGKEPADSDLKNAMLGSID